MGFFEDHKSFLYRMPQKLTFYRNTSDRPSNILHVDDAVGYSVTLNLKDIVWRVPQVKFNIKLETEMYLRQEILNST